MARRLRRTVGREPRDPFPGSEAYWERRYAAGGDSGAGSYARFAAFKAEILNAFVARHGITHVLELGCGDGNQLALARYPSYTGFDVSPTAIARCRERFAGDRTKTFHTMDLYAGETAELALSLDVVFHLVEEAVFERYMHTLFDASARWVILYSSDTDDNEGFAPHVKHRKITRWIGEHRRGWRLVEHVPNRHPWRGDHRTGSFADFFIYEKAAPA